jgi:Rod binding domain-containing protein
MSVTGASGSPLPTSGLPPVNPALEPAWVRNGSQATQKSYQTALAFEEMLVEQLSKSLTAASGLESESGQEGEASAQGGSSSGPLSSMLPQALASGVMSAGGFGLAAQITRQMQDAAGTSQSQAQLTGGAAAGASALTGSGAVSGSDVVSGSRASAPVEPSAASGMTGGASA